MALLRLAVSAVCFFILTSLALADGQRVILVLDASGSMWGQINGTAKIDIAKDVVGKVVGSWKTEDELGLVAYGHRKKGACDDIETLIEPGPFDAKAFLSSVKALSPKGKTPMTQAVRQAAESLKFTEKQATVILVSDGIETCDPNPCAVAEELEKLGVGLTVHTVGFGLDDKGAVGQLKCLAEKTGGIAVLAEDAKELEDALKQTVEAKVETPPPAPEPSPAPVETHDVKGQVKMAEGIELPKPFNDNVVWVFSTNNNGEAGEYIQTEYKHEMKADLAKGGSLLAMVQTDLVKMSVPFSHEDGKLTDLNVVLNAGVVSFKGMMDETTALPADGPVWTFTTADGTYYGTGYGATPRHLFAAGDYKLKLEQGAAVVETSFRVEAGKQADLVVALGAGIARYQVTYDGSQAASDAVAVELRKPAGMDGNMEHVATEFGQSKEFRAAAGDYVLVATQGIARAEQPFKLQAGKSMQVSITLNAGAIVADAADATRIEVKSGAENMDGSREHFHTEFGEKLNLVANAGQYLVIAYGADDAVLGQKLVAVEAGKRATAALP